MNQALFSVNTTTEIGWFYRWQGLHEDFRRDFLGDAGGAEAAAQTK